MHLPTQNNAIQPLTSSGTLPSKRPRSTSVPSSPTGSTSSKRAISEDDFPADRTMRAEGEMVSGSSPMKLDDQKLEQDAGVSVEKAEQEEVEKRTEDMHIGDHQGRKKYEQLYNDLLIASPPPFNNFYRYALIPTSFVQQLKTAAFEDGKDVTLDMSPLVDGEGKDVYVIDTVDDETEGEKSLFHTATKERVWKLKPGLQEDDDFVYISEEGWNKLITGLGATDQPRLLRYCVNERVQLVPPEYTLYIVSTSTDKAAPIKFTCPPETLLFIFIRLLQSLAGTVMSDVKSKGVRAWMFDPSMVEANVDVPSLAALENLYLSPAVLPAIGSRLNLASKQVPGNVTCEDKSYQSGDAFVLELGDKLSGNQYDWLLDVGMNDHPVVKPVVNLPPVPTAPPPLFSRPAVYGGTGNSAASSSSSLAPDFGMSMRSQRREREPVKTRGLVGLQNLGNTCFMNSAVQCLSNTPELNKYFLSSVYKEEINRDNPLGMHGLIADSFGLVVESLWNDYPQSSFSPRQLKQYTGKFAPQFQGYGQHDTQEFLAFLLDGLHEDLNRIYKKPYIEKPDWKAGGGDKELALLGKECWEGYKKRNDSVIVDLFQGQLMSTLVCPECHKESITMDPFMYLTVPLPITQTRIFKCRFVPRDPEKDAVSMEMLIPANASFAAIKGKIAAMMDSNAAHMLGTDIFAGRTYAWWLDGDHNSECKDHDLAIFYDLGVPVVSTRKAVGTAANSDIVAIPVHTCQSTESRGFKSNEMTSNSLSLVPFYISLTRAEAADAAAVRDAVARGYTRFLRSDMRDHLWVPNSSSHAIVPMTPAEEQPMEFGEEEKVAEIHLDGGEPKVIEVPVRSGANSPVLSLKSAHGNLSSTSLATLASARSSKSTSQRLVPRADLYKIHVADASTAQRDTGYSFFKKEKKEDTGVTNMWKGELNNSVTSNWSSLESRRKARKEKGNMLGRIASGIFGGSEKGDDDEREGRSKASGQGSSSRAESPVAGISTPTAPQPVVRPGEAIFVEWSPKRYQEYIDEQAVKDSWKPEIDPAIAEERKRRAAGKAVTLEECLNEFSKEETLGQDDLWYCPVCKKHQAATKKLDIYKAPDILVICIKRFGSSRRLSDKLDTMVNFPLEGLDLGERVGERRVAKSLKLNKEEGKEYGMDLDWDEVPTEITPEGEGNMLYDLYAVDNHFGGLGGGHYTAFCKNREDGQWWNYDDSRVSKANPEAVQSRAAYLLFYRRRTARPIGGISRVKAEEAESRATSRAPSPAPSASGMTGSRTLPPSGLQHAMGAKDDGEDDGFVTESDAVSSSAESLPSYSRAGSPAVSDSDSPRNNTDDGAATDEEDGFSAQRLSLAGGSLGFGSSLGYGNTAWNLSANGNNTEDTAVPSIYTANSADRLGVNYPFGQSHSSGGTTLVNQPSPELDATTQPDTAGSTSSSMLLGQPVQTPLQSNVDETDSDVPVVEGKRSDSTTKLSEASVAAGTAASSDVQAPNVSVRPATDDMDVEEP